MVVQNGVSVGANTRISNNKLIVRISPDTSAGKAMHEKNSDYLPYATTLA